MYSFIKCSIFFTFIYIFICSFNVDAEKRILLSDPDVVQNRLAQLELEMQTMKAESQQKTIRISQLEKLVNSNTASVDGHFGNSCLFCADHMKKVEDQKIPKRKCLIESKLNPKVLKGVKGAVYTRWGRKDCPSNGTELVYSGIAAGAWYANPGSAVDYLCLPHDPAFIANDVHRTSIYIDYMYGVEYQDNYFGDHMDGSDVPCAVCRAKQASASLMVPGKLTCPGNWKMEYDGRLAGGSHSFGGNTQYVCVDMNVQAFEKGGVDRNGKLLVGVQAKCGSLSCPPYKDGSMITCVVCSE